MSRGSTAKPRKSGADRHAARRRRAEAESARSSREQERDRTPAGKEQGRGSDPRSMGDAGDLEQWLDAERLLGFL
ncbi:hypothetical protein [Tahibacter caeni]|uniref:hypothetical protein n=1 Tax=Tahibacter caeni TaxID=1453545 RepID=UPI002148459A|nr:hypothetical protein [Tahibacter caeni]